MPHEIWVQEELEDAEVIASFLTARRGQKVRFVVQKMGEKERLVELAEKNAKMVLSQDKEKIKREELRTIGAMNWGLIVDQVSRNQAGRSLRYFQYQRF